jgi:hypothetical protein
MRNLTDKASVFEECLQLACNLGPFGWRLLIGCLLDGMRISEMNLMLNAVGCARGMLRSSEGLTVAVEDGDDFGSIGSGERRRDIVQRRWSGRGLLGLVCCPSALGRCYHFRGAPACES